MKIPQDIVKNILITEKGSYMGPQNKYLFVVNRSANKIEIKKAVEEIYKVKVADVNTLMMRGKKRRIRFVEGKKSDWKKAIVTLQQGQRIEIK
jgi:large subunit ribosomal protein L23